MIILRFFGQVLGLLLFLIIAIAMIPVKILNSFLLERPKYPEFYESYDEQLNFYEGRDEWEKSCNDVPLKAVLLYSLHWAHIEIENGGFWQFFFNSTGTIAPEARDGFAAIGMPDAAAVIQQAMDRVGEPFPFDREQRQEIVGDPDDRMDFAMEDDQIHTIIGNPKFIGGAPRYFAHADAYASEG